MRPVSILILCFSVLALSGPASRRLAAQDALRFAELIDSNWEEIGARRTVLSLAFTHAIRATASDDFRAKGYYYVDFFNVQAPAEQADWSFDRSSVRHVRRIFYPDQKVLRFIFYADQGAPPLIELRPADPGAEKGKSFEIVIDGGGPRFSPLPSLRGADGAASSGDDPGSRKIVILDPGHGGKSSGAQTSRRIRGRHREEKDIVLQISELLRSLLERTPNIDVRMTRTKDRYVSLQDRIAFAERSDGDLFLSVHLNATSSRRKDARGFEIYYLSDGTRATNRELEALENDHGIALNGKISGGESLKTILADLANTKLLERRRESYDLCRVTEHVFSRQGPFRGRSRGVKSANFQVLMNFEMPAVLAECGFLDNPAEAARLVRPEVQREIAILLFNAINLYFARTDPDFRGYQVPLN